MVAMCYAPGFVVRVHACGERENSNIHVCTSVSEREGGCLSPYLISRRGNQDMDHQWVDRMSGASTVLHDRQLLHVYMYMSGHTLTCIYIHVYVYVYVYVYT